MCVCGYPNLGFERLSSKLLHGIRAYRSCILRSLHQIPPPLLSPPPPLPLFILTNPSRQLLHPGQLISIASRPSSTTTLPSPVPSDLYKLSPTCPCTLATATSTLLFAYSATLYSVLQLTPLSSLFCSRQILVTSCSVLAMLLCFMLWLL